MDFFFYSFKMSEIDLFCHVSTRTSWGVQEVQPAIEISASFCVKFPELCGSDFDTGSDKLLSGSVVESFPYNSSDH